MSLSCSQKVDSLGVHSFSIGSNITAKAIIRRNFATAFIRAGILAATSALGVAAPI